MRLPKVDELAVLKKIKTNEPLIKMPVVILTTSSAEKDVAMAYEYLANNLTSRHIIQNISCITFNHTLYDLEIRNIFCQGI